ncbi:fasciclin domain-containing protein [Rubrivirga sp. IMCC45206]|uniref:fasciclin domain-containing protein n=1 Tax=Rubrivirga sp. IMCC45206 TaxID=3391614 RepID=UPI00398FFB88
MIRTLLLSLLVVAVAGCSTGRMNTDNTLNAELTLIPSALSPANTIVENAMGQPELSALVNAVVAADLADALSGPGPFTVFAPINAAFDGMDVSAIDADDLAATLQYHVVAGDYSAADLSDGMVLEALDGSELTIQTLVAGDPMMMVEDADIIYADIEASNGRIHLINLVLNPTPGGGAQ